MTVTEATTTMRILNLGCGYKTSDAPEVVNIDWGIYQRLARNPVLRRVAPYVIGPARAERLRRLGDNIVVHDLSKGIPAEDSSVDAVYHSHLLEHLDRPVAEGFMREILRVLRPGGIQRISVPDLEGYVRSYLEHLDNGGANAEHDAYIAPILEQSVRREAHGTSLQSRPRRIVENLIMGDARKRGETHQWMYDHKNLAALLERTGYTDIRRVDWNVSDIPGWDAYGLDRDEAGGEYKPESLYVEARKP
jgi:predicted SAM-dependent methyltransferase